MPKEHQNSFKIKLEKELKLAEDFSAPTYEEWKTTAKESLKGTPFEKLVTHTYEEIDLQPIYTKQDIKGLTYIEQKPGFDSHLRGTTPGGYLTQPWEICQEIPANLPQQFNEILKHDLQQGQNSINLLLDQATQKGLDSDAAAKGEVGRGGTAISTLEDLSTALADIQIEKYPLHINAGFCGLEVVMMLTALFKQQGKEINRIKGSVDADPLGYLAIHGHLPVSLRDIYDRMAWVTNWASQYTPHLKTIGVSGLPYHNAGADAVRELAYVLATAVEYFDQLLDRDVAVDEIAGHMRFTFAIGPFYFMEIARLRAARMLWAKTVEACGGSNKAQKMTVHARTSSYNQTTYNPYVNMLRTSTEAFSAVVAGVDSLHTNPFNEVLGNPNEFSRRVARNTQILLHEECRLDRLIDPAGGSYYVEKLTHEICQKAWKLFQEIETMGGMSHALQKDFPQNETAAVHEKRKQDFAKQKSSIVGTNYSANVKEKKLQTNFPDYEDIYQVRKQYLKKYRDNRKVDQAVIDEKVSALKTFLVSDTIDLVRVGAEALLTGATIGEICAAVSPKKAGTVKIKSLELLRAAEIFETLRDAVEIHKEKTGSGSSGARVFLVTMGPLSQHKARADFSQSFFEVGGFDVIYPQFPQGQGFDTPESAVEAILQSEAPIVVICSTDETYPQLVPPITRALKEKNPGIIIVLAGYPKDQVEIHKQVGVDEFIYMGANTQQILSRVLKKSGILE
ncbi:MAG: acyl-CoA mutase large subunit family protein [Candidatus Aminicenantes bacterium]|nr:MAG: acyl-CoA mutase large subunit family protein [Candidatus Aminicenantes bacterium]